MKISVITVTYNCDSVLGDCLASVATQLHDDVEHIVIDGNSTDGTLKLLQSRRNQLSVIVSEPDDGIYDAMNKGLSLANGDIIGFLNSDDFYASNSVLSHVAALFKNDPLLDACYADLIYVDQIDINHIVRYWKSSEFVSGAFGRGWCPPHPTLFVRRSVYERYGNFDLSYRIAADVELMMRFLEVFKIRIRHVPEIWVKMRMGGTTNKNIKNILMQNKEILRALHNHSLPANSIRFLLHKLISRGIQFLQRPIA